MLADHSFTQFSGTEQTDVIAVVARGVQVRALSPATVTATVDVGSRMVTTDGDAFTRAAGGDDALNLADGLAGGSSVDPGAGRRDAVRLHPLLRGEAAPASPRLDLARGRSTSARPGPRPPSSAPGSPS